MFIWFELELHRGGVQIEEKFGLFLFHVTAVEWEVWVATDIGQQFQGLLSSLVFMLFCQPEKIQKPFDGFGLGVTVLDEDVVVESE